jgi:hypothetical protein
MNEIKSHCKDIGEGEGRIAACLTKAVRDIRKGNAAGRVYVPFLSVVGPLKKKHLSLAGRKVGKKCMKELSDFKIHRSSNINRDIPLGK